MQKRGALVNNSYWKPNKCSFLWYLTIEWKNGCVLIIIMVIIAILRFHLTHSFYLHEVGTIFIPKIQVRTLLRRLSDLFEVADEVKRKLYSFRYEHFGTWSTLCLFPVYRFSNPEESIQPDTLSREGLRKVVNSWVISGKSEL